MGRPAAIWQTVKILQQPATRNQQIRKVHGLRPTAQRTVHFSQVVHLQPFSQKSHTPTVPKEFQIGLYDPAEADLEHFWNCCSAGFLGERLYCSEC